MKSWARLREVVNASRSLSKEMDLKFLHLSNNNNKDSNQDRMFKLKPLSDLLKERFSSVYIPGSVVSIDESMIP